MINCRDPAVRRQALSLLSRLSLPRQEGTWNANDASRVGQWVIDVEEEGLGAVESAEDVPNPSASNGLMLLHTWRSDSFI